MTVEGIRHALDRRVVERDVEFLRRFGDACRRGLARRTEPGPHEAVALDALTW
jgi:hypothetical protein